MVTLVRNGGGGSQILKRGVQHAQVWVKVAIGCGMLLGALLLIQTIRTYFFVADKIIRDQAAQEVERKEAALMQAAISAKIAGVHQFGPLIEELQLEAPKEIAWVRIIDINGQVLAHSGTATTAVPTPEQLRRQTQLHQSRRTMVKSAAGDILVVDSRLRFFGRPTGPPPGRLGEHGPFQPGGRDAGAFFSEIAIYMDGVAVDFGALRQNLIIGCLAAVALLVSMLSIGLLFSRYIRARQLEQQVELARTVQNDLLPGSEGRKPAENLDFAAVFLPAATIGGDFYDVFSGEGAPVSIVLGDVAGKGISAALLMGVLHGAIRSLRWTRSAVDQEEASQWLNRFLCEKTARERFVSLFLAYFVPQTGVLRYVNAGHLPPLLIRAANGSAVERLESGGPVLGLLPHAQYRSGTVQVDAGDVLVVYSDGVAEATNASDEEFGEGRIAEIVRGHVAEGPRAICDAILAEVTRFLGPLKPHDDQTLLIVRLVPAKVPADQLETETPIQVLG